MSVFDAYVAGVNLRRGDQAVEAQNALTQAIQTSGPRSPQAMNALAGVNPVAAIQLAQPDIQAQRQAAAGLVSGILRAPEESRPQLYAQALQQALQMGMDLSGIPAEYPGEQVLKVMGAVLGMEDGARTEFERLLQSVPEAQRGQAVMQRLGLEPDANTRLRADRERSTSAEQQRFEMLVRGGVDSETAAGIVGGRFKVGEDEYGRSRRIDLAADQASTPTPGEGVPTEAPPLDFDPGGAFGASSQVGRGLNVVTDFFGMGLAAPQSQQAANGIMAFNERLKRQIVDAYNGRPSNYLLQSIEALLPDPRSILIGDAGALEKYRALDRELAAEESSAARRLQAPLQGNARVEADLQVQGLQGARARLRQVIDGFGAQGGGGAELPSDLRERGWSDDEWNGLSPEDRRRAMEIIGGSGAPNPNDAPAPPPAQNVIKGSIQQNQPVAPITLARAFTGATENRDAGALSAFFQKMTGDNINPAETAWCAAFANAVLKASGSNGTGRLNARSFLDWGEPVHRPSEGDVVVLWRESPDSWKGHVGFFAGYTDDGRVRVLGGNQNDQVNEKAYPADRVLGFRRPPSLRRSA